MLYYESLGNKELADELADDVKQIVYDCDARHISDEWLQTDKFKEWGDKLEVIAAEMRNYKVGQK